MSNISAVNFGGWELFLLMLLLLVVGALAYGFTWTVKRFTK